MTIINGLPPWNIQKSAPSMTELEMTTLDWLVEILGLPEHFKVGSGSRREEKGWKMVQFMKNTVIEKSNWKKYFPWPPDEVLKVRATPLGLSERRKLLVIWYRRSPIFKKALQLSCRGCCALSNDPNISGKIAFYRMKMSLGGRSPCFLYFLGEVNSYSRFWQCFHPRLVRHRLLSRKS